MRVSVIISIVVGVIAIGSAVGYTLPKLATQAFVAAHARIDTERYEDLIRYVGGIDLVVTQGAAESAELRAIRLEAEIKRQKKAGEDYSFNEAELRIIRKRVLRLDERANDLLNPE